MSQDSFLNRGGSSSSPGLTVLFANILGHTHLQEPCRGALHPPPGVQPWSAEAGFLALLTYLSPPPDHKVLDGKIVSYESPYPQN